VAERGNPEQYNDLLWTAFVLRNTYRCAGFVAAVARFCELTSACLDTDHTVAHCCLVGFEILAVMTVSKLSVRFLKNQAVAQNGVVIKKWLFATCDGNHNHQTTRLFEHTTQHNVKCAPWALPRLQEGPPIITKQTGQGAPQEMSQYKA
jgi:hypothetical protein